MLTTIREKATGWIAWAIVILITIPFALWGINSYFEGAAKVVVATANGIDIEQQVYQQALADQRRSLVQLMGRNVDAEYFATRAFKRQVLESLIDRNLQADYLRRRGFRLTDQQLASRIRSMPAFQSDGAFDQQRYEMLVRNAGLSVEGFEQQQRQQGALEQLLAGLSQTAFVTDAAVDQALQLLGQKRIASYALLDIALFRDAAIVTEDAIQDQYESNPDGYFAPAEVQVDYLRLSVADLAAEIEVEPAAARHFFDENPERFSLPGSRSARHILIALPAEAGEAAVVSAREKAAALVKRARDGEDFAALAQAHSDDPGSARRGGDLGLIRPGTMAEAFEEAVFALARGEISDPVRTEYGWHVIKLVDLTLTRVETFAEVHGEIEDELRRREAEERFVVLAEEFQNIVYEQPDSLEPGAEALELEVRHSEWFSRESGTGIAASGVVREAAFSTEVLVDQLNSEMLEVDADTLVAVHVRDHRERRRQSLAEVHESIGRQLREAAAGVDLEAAGSVMVERFQNGADWAQVLADGGLEARELPQDMGAASEPLEQAVVEAVFSAPVPAPGVAGYGGLRLDASHYLVYRLERVEAGNPAAVSSAEREKVAQLLLTRRGEELFAEVNRTLRAAAEVSIYDDNL